MFFLVSYRSSSFFLPFVFVFYAVRFGSSCGCSWFFMPFLLVSLRFSWRSSSFFFVSLAVPFRFFWLLLKFFFVFYAVSYRFFWGRWPRKCSFSSLLMFVLVFYGIRNEEEQDQIILNFPSLASGLRPFLVSRGVFSGLRLVLWSLGVMVEKFTSSGSPTLSPARPSMIPRRRGSALKTEFGVSPRRWVSKSEQLWWEGEEMNSKGTA